jgi:hypothetical protein
MINWGLQANFHESVITHTVKIRDVHKKHGRVSINWWVCKKPTTDNRKTLKLNPEYVFLQTLMEESCQ